MTKPEWGTKRTCLNCGTRFYDMQRTVVECPKCGSESASDSAPKVRRSNKKAAVVDSKPKVAVAPVDDDAILDDVDVDMDDADDDDALIEDTSDLAEDDDMSDMMEHMGPNDDE